MTIGFQKAQLNPTVSERWARTSPNRAHKGGGEFEFKPTLSASSVNQQVEFGLDDEPLKSM